MSSERPEDPGLPPGGDPASDVGGPGGPAGPPEPPPAPPAMPPPPANAGRIGLPWERSDGRSVGSALETIRLVLLQPGEAFAMMRRDGSLGDPLLFLVVFGTLGAFFGLLWQNTFRTVFGRLADADLVEVAAINSFGVVSLLMAPIFVLLFTAVTAVLVHLALMVLGGAPHPLDVTLRTVCYASGSTYLFAIVPFCGGIVSFIWWLVALSIGLREAHEVPGGRAVGAVLAPIVLVCCCCAALSFMFSAAIMSLAGMGL